MHNKKIYYSKSIKDIINIKKDFIILNKYNLLLYV